MSKVTLRNIPGRFLVLQPLDQMQEFLADTGEKFKIKVDTLIREDGSNQKFLLNYNEETSECLGYIDFRTMTGYIILSGGTTHY